VLSVLCELGAAGKPSVEALNKIDLANNIPESPGALPVSAVTGEGLNNLRAEIAARIARLRHKARVMVPYRFGAALSLIHERGKVLAEEHLADGTEVTCLLDSALYRRVEKMLDGNGRIELA